MRLIFYEPQAELTPELAHNVLELVKAELDHPLPSVEEMGSYTWLELVMVYDWAMREHLRASDHHEIRARPVPSILRPR